MPTFTATDSAHMARALELARRGRYRARPNPRVGCVLVRDGAVVGEGWHETAGGAHAEIAALADAGERARNATAYVTLEPCAHHGKTPPCAEALIAAGVSRVVAAMADPFPEVSGQGFAALRRAGVEVASGLFETAARALNEGYLSRIERGQPFLRLKIAAGIDGGTAMSSGESRWITGRAARADVQRLRARSGAIMTGVGTVIEDDPSLTVRALECPPPIRIVVDSRLRTPPTAKLLGLAGQTVIYCVDDAAGSSLEREGVSVVKLKAKNGRVPLRELLEDLGARAVNDLLVECGPVLAGSLLAEGLVDELVIYQSPHIMGSETLPMFVTAAWKRLDDRRPLDIVDVRRVGDDIRITARPATTRNSCLPE